MYKTSDVVNIIRHRRQRRRRRGASCIVVVVVVGRGCRRRRGRRRRRRRHRRRYRVVRQRYRTSVTSCVALQRRDENVARTPHSHRRRCKRRCGCWYVKHSQNVCVIGVTLKKVRAR